MAIRVARAIRLRVSQASIIAVVAALIGFPVAAVCHISGALGANIAAACFLGVGVVAFVWLMCDVCILPQPIVRDEQHEAEILAFAVSDGFLYFGEYPFTANHSFKGMVAVPSGRYTARMSWTATYADEDLCDMQVTTMSFRCKEQTSPRPKCAESEIVSDSATVIVADRSQLFYQEFVDDFVKRESEVVEQVLSRRKGCIWSWIVCDDAQGHCLVIDSGEGAFRVASRILEDNTFEILITFRGANGEE